MHTFETRAKSLTSKVGAVSDRPASKCSYVLIHRFSFERAEDASLELADGQGVQRCFPVWAGGFFFPNDIWEVVVVIMVVVVNLGEYWRIFHCLFD